MNAKMEMTSTMVPDRMQCMEVWGGNSAVDRSLSTPGLQIWLRSEPYERAVGGGDVYYVSSCASGRITRLLLADVSGHGEQAAQVACDLRDLMRRNVNLVNQSRLVREMNRLFSQLELERFATSLTCTFFAPTRSIQYCNAGHPPPLLYRAREGRWAFAHEESAIRPGKGLVDTPLGVFDEADYSLFTTKLAEGDMMLCVSDAFTESQNAAGQLLGLDGLLRTVQELDVSQPSAIIPSLVERLKSEQDDNLDQDDATALLFRCDRSTTTLRDNLLAPFRLLRSVRDATVLSN